MPKINRTPLKERPFPDYTRKEEMLNMWSHIFGAVLYQIGKKKRYRHFVFHVFVVVAVVVQFIGVVKYLI